MRYQDIVPDYEEYKRLQIQDYMSFEGEVERWAAPQRAAIDWFFRDRPFCDVSADARVLDCACGDGTGLRHLQSLGFGRLTAVELCPEKAALAAATGVPVYVRDAHDLSCFPDASFDVVYSSHTLEHCYEPLRVLAEFRRVLAPAGQLFLILPYPDGGIDRAHGGKYDLRTDKLDGLQGLQHVLEVGGYWVAGTLLRYRDGGEVWVRATPR